MRIFILSIIITLFISLTCPANSFSVGIELYPDRMEGIFNDNWLGNDREWYATTVDFNINFGKLHTNWQIKTFLSSTNLFKYAPSSVKFSNSISYRFDKIKISYSHYCRHYFQQFFGEYSDQDKLTLSYIF